MAPWTLAMAARSAAVSGPEVEAATNTAWDVVLDWNGAARAAACTLGSEVGRNSESPLLATLESEGSPTTKAKVTIAHPTTISHRNRTVNRPSAAKKRRSSTRPPPYACVGSRSRGYLYPVGLRARCGHWGAGPSSLGPLRWRQACAEASALPSRASAFDSPWTGVGGGRWRQGHRRRGASRPIHPRSFPAAGHGPCPCGRW